MDLNEDGHQDILSGSYSRQDKDMAGTFQVLWGSEDGFRVAETLNGTDDEPLIIPATEKQMIEKICTRPFAADIDNDGDLDLIVGNFGGTFYLFEGQGKGKFSPKPVQMKDAKEKPLRVQQHSDPFLVDWDEDGDLDMVSGSSSGGVSLSINEGSKTEPAFGKFRSIIKSVGHQYGTKTKYGTEHLTGPQTATRVWVDDVNGDGKFDLLVGDSTTINNVAEGVDEEEVEELMEQWQTDYTKMSTKYSKIAMRMQKLTEEIAELRKQSASEEEGTESKKEEADEEEAEQEEASSEEKEADDARSLEDQILEKEEQLQMVRDEMQEMGEELSNAYSKRNEIVESEMTGFVWVYYQK